MSHFAKVVDGVVIQVIVAEPEFFQTFIDSVAGQWIQTSINTRYGVHYGQDGKPDGGVALRGNYAGIGYIYDRANDVFYEPRPRDVNGLLCNSWTISAPTWNWTPPVPFPDTTEPFIWDEANKEWIKVTV